MTVSVAEGHDDLQQFIDTVTSLSNKKQKALKGYDNYCYITGTVLSYEDVQVTSALSVHTRTDCGTKDYLGHTSTDWKTYETTEPKQQQPASTKKAQRVSTRRRRNGHVVRG